MLTPSRQDHLPDSAMRMDARTKVRGTRSTTPGLDFVTKGRVEKPFVYVRRPRLTFGQPGEDAWQAKSYKKWFQRSARAKSAFRGFSTRPKVTAHGARSRVMGTRRLYGQKTEKLSIIRDGHSRRVFWQSRCYDHNCRTPETTREKINYCHKNPVTRGLVKSPDDWPWSSYRWYAGLAGVELEIDGFEL